MYLMLEAHRGLRIRGTSLCTFYREIKHVLPRYWFTKPAGATSFDVSYTGLFTLEREGALSSIISLLGIGETGISTMIPEDGRVWSRV